MKSILVELTKESVKVRITVFIREKVSYKNLLNKIKQLMIIQKKVFCGVDFFLCLK